MNARIFVCCVVFVGIAAIFLVVHAETKDQQTQYTTNEPSVSKRDSMRSRGYSRRHAQILKQRREAPEALENIETQ